MAWVPKLQVSFRRWRATVDVEQVAGSLTGQIRFVGDHRLTSIPRLVAAPGHTVGDLPVEVIGDPPAPDVDVAAPLVTVPWWDEQAVTLRRDYVISNGDGVTIQLLPWQIGLWDGDLAWESGESDRFRLPTKLETFVAQYGDIIPELHDEGLIPPQWVDELGL